MGLHQETPKRIDIIREALDNNISKRAISKKHDIPLSTIQYLSKRFHLTDKTIEDYWSGLLNHTDITPQLKEILDGCIIGDGCYALAPSSRCAQLVFQSKSKGLAKHLLMQLLPYGIVGHIKPTTRQHRRLMTLYYKEFKDQEERWYDVAGDYEKAFSRTRRKIIPRDLNLTATTCLWWYLGDGSLSSDKYITAHLHTESFALEEVKFLQERILSQLDVHSTIVKDHRPPYHPYYRLNIFNKNAMQFFSYIGKCPVKSMNYRWPKALR